MDYQAFVNCEKSLLIAPAGYGKTTTIVKCLEETEGKQLILTHTHAGVASIKGKIKKSPQLNLSSYSIETISSFAKRLVTAFYVGNDIPDDEQSNEYHRFLIDQSIQMIDASPIQDIVKISYSGLFVDEYQDCTISQHEMILKLSECLPTHILCDPLQGIFDFHEDEDWNVVERLGNFRRFPELSIPQRWRQEGCNRELGDALHVLRINLINHQPINLNDYASCIEVKSISERDKYQPGTEYYRSIRGLLNEDVLFIDPNSANDRGRKNFVKAFKPTVLLERFDHPIYFHFSNMIDKISDLGGERVIRDIIKDTYFSTGFNKWFNHNGFKNKTNPEDARLVENIRSLIGAFQGPQYLREILIKVYQLPDMSIHRHGAIRIKSLLKACEDSILMGTTVYEAMRTQRSNIRQLGRILAGKSIGTTLLTKGLEFDTVAILDAHKFNCPKHFYVAMTRACKKLVIFTERTELTFSA